MEEFKDRLKELRETEGISMNQLAQALGVSSAAVCKWENGIAEPKVTYLIKLSNYFDCTIDYLVGKTSDFETAPEARQNAQFKLSNKEKQLVNSYRTLSPNLKNLLQETVNVWNKTDKNSDN